MHRLERRSAAVSTVASAILSLALGVVRLPAMAAGIEVHPPAGYVVKQIPRDGTYASEYEVTSATDTDFGCQIGFQPSAAMPGRTQAEINAAMTTAAYGDAVRACLTPFGILSTQPFPRRDVTGLVLVGVPRGGEGQVKALIVIYQTPPGRTNVVCVGPDGRFDALRPAFEAIARGVVPAR